MGGGGGMVSTNIFRPLGPQFGPKIGGGKGGGDAGPFPGSTTGYKICICSVILRDFKYFWNYKDFSFILPKISDAIYGFTNLRIFLTPISITFFNPKILGFLAFFYEKKKFLGSEMWKIKFQKIVANLLDKLRKLYNLSNGTVI